MTLTHCSEPEKRGAIVGRTPFLLFVGTWNTELKSTDGVALSKEKAIEKMKSILGNSIG